MNSTPGELPVKFSTNATSSGAAAAPDAMTTAPAAARTSRLIDREAWPNTLAESLKNPLELLAMTIFPWVHRLAPGFLMPDGLPQPISGRCDEHHKMVDSGFPGADGAAKGP
jgi:hypothetical protein